jgi:hypothetical protein
MILIAATAFAVLFSPAGVLVLLPPHVRCLV